MAAECHLLSKHEEWATLSSKSADQEGRDEDAELFAELGEMMKEDQKEMLDELELYGLKNPAREDTSWFEYMCRSSM